MFHVKLHLFLTVVCVQVAALFVDRNVPYWPIEISRMAASGPMALQAFRIGTLTLGAAMAMDGTWTEPVLLLLWLAMFIIAWVDDVTSQTGHMFGVALLGASACWQTSLRGREAVPIFVIASVVFVARLVLKASTVWWNEVGGRNLPLFHLLLPKTWFRIASHAKALMFGERAFKSVWTHTAFATAGALQWCVFAVLSALY